MTFLPLFYYSIFQCNQSKPALLQTLCDDRKRSGKCDTEQGLVGCKKTCQRCKSKLVIPNLLNDCLCLLPNFDNLCRFWVCKWWWWFLQCFWCWGVWQQQWRHINYVGFNDVERMVQMVQVSKNMWNLLMSQTIPNWFESMSPNFFSKLSNDSDFRIFE